jgi:ankyrin repeat protein
MINKEGFNPLHIACRVGLEEVFDKLISLGADIDAPGPVTSHIIIIIIIIIITTLQTILFLPNREYAYRTDSMLLLLHVCIAS